MGLLFSSTQAAERPWQQIVDPRATEVAAQFNNPPPEYGLSLLWGWNDDVNERVVKADLDTIRSRNIRVVTIEAGYRMPDPYLSKGWFERIKMAVDEAEKRDMRVWLIDEGKYPSRGRNGKTRYRGLFKHQLWAFCRSLWMNLIRIKNYLAQPAQVPA